MQIKKNILMIGYGAMGSALGNIWKPHYNIEVVDPNLPGALSGIEDISADYAPHIIIVAIKPQVFNDIVPVYAAQFQNPDIIWISIAAGKTLQQLRNLIPTGQVVRSMPNLPAQFGAGLTALVSEYTLIESVSRLFEYAGKILWLNDDSLMDIMTALSGSGPAYIYHMAECLADAAIKLGLPEELATLAARQTIYGAGTMLAKTITPSSKLRENVTSPAGTTQAGLEVLMPEMLPLIERTLKAAHKRSVELK